MTRTMIKLALGAALVAMCLPSGASAGIFSKKAKPEAASAISASGSIDPRGPSNDVQLGALAPANLNKPRPKPPFSMTGTWFVDLSKGFSSWMFGPPYPKFMPAAQAEVDAAAAAAKAGRAYKDTIGRPACR